MGSHLGGYLRGGLCRPFESGFLHVDDLFVGLGILFLNTTLYEFQVSARGVTVGEFHFPHSDASSKWGKLSAREFVSSLIGGYLRILVGDVNRIKYTPAASPSGCSSSFVYDVDCPRPETVRLLRLPSFELWGTGVRLAGVWN